MMATQPRNVTSCRKACTYIMYIITPLIRSVSSQHIDIIYGLFITYKHYNITLSNSALTCEPQFITALVSHWKNVNCNRMKVCSQLKPAQTCKVHVYMYLNTTPWQLNICNIIDVRDVNRCIPQCIPGKNQTTIDQYISITKNNM